MFYPVSSPRVLYDPVRCRVQVNTETDQQHGMIESRQAILIRNRAARVGENLVFVMLPTNRIFFCYNLIFLYTLQTLFTIFHSCILRHSTVRRTLEAEAFNKKLAILKMRLYFCTKNSPLLKFPHRVSNSCSRALFLRLTWMS